MVAGVERQCVVCGEPVTTCVLPAYCVRCDPSFIEMWRGIHEEAESARLNANPAAAEGEGRDDGNATAEEG